MKFTSDIVRTANQLVSKGLNRSTATKIAMLRVRSEYQAMCQILDYGHTVTVSYFADKHAGAAQHRKAICLGAAFASMLWVPDGGTPHGDHLHVYYDLDREGVRSFKKQNFISFSIN